MREFHAIAVALPLQFQVPTMRHTRISSSLLLVLGLLALLAMPVTAFAGSPVKKAPAAQKSQKAKKVDKARSEAAKKGWETRRINQKAEANWASRVAKNPKADKPGAKEAFIKRSVASQRGWQTRKLAMASGKAATKKSAKAPKKTKKVAKTSKKGKKVAAKDKKSKKTAKSDGAAGEEGLIDSSAGAADFKNALAKFEEADFARSENRGTDADIAQMEGHDMMAQAAFAAADQYEAAGKADEAAKLNAFGEGHLAEADKLEKTLNEQPGAEAAAVAERPAAQQGRIRRFFARLNPRNWGKNRNSAPADEGQMQFGE